MSTARRRGSLSAAGMLLGSVLTLSNATAQARSGEDRRTTDAMLHAMSEHEHGSAAEQHLRLSAPRAVTAADSARASELILEIRRDLAKYRDVSVAQADGYQQFLPNLPQPIYHFTNWASGLGEAFGFDPAHPTSLLYRKNADGSFTLTGVMYTAPRWVEESALDARIPLGVARWHQHINWCIPKRGEQSRWLESRDGQPLFGPESPVTTPEACAAAGGRFLPQLFGWMVHVNAFESDDPRVIWGDHH